jgi:phage shock protein PspC (stress-responsive transcriptional regulator)
MLLGVCAGLAARYQVPVTLVRVVFVLLTLFHGFGILLYLVLWAILPGRNEGEEPKASQWVQTVRRFFRAVRKAFHEEARRGRERAGTGDAEVEAAGGVKPAESR